MRPCPYCGHVNLDNATQCRKCDASLVAQKATIYRPARVGSQKARTIRDKALLILVLGLLMKVYWGGYGPWPVIDYPTLAELRVWLEPLLLYGGAALYALGLILKYV
jgi:hypothetical protein